MSKLNWWQIIITIITLATFFITRQITDDNVLFEIFTPFVVTLIIVLIALCISSANALITAFVALDSVLIVIAITFFILAFTINSERFFIAAFIALMLITVITIELIFCASRKLARLFIPVGLIMTEGKFTSLTWCA